jgi:multidrug efflux pump subunit AcrB
MLALVLMVGIVIDDAIVVLENIFRFIEEKKMKPFEAANWKRLTAPLMSTWDAFAWPLKMMPGRRREFSPFGVWAMFLPNSKNEVAHVLV